ncbi:MAG: prephenate dehydratase [Bdellovibrio sp.]|nr:MAG: prephenate dehydratase [Bdellovibrio sp.]
MTGKLRIGIQGVKASFHYMAALKYFAGRDLEFVECRTFRRLCDALANDETDYNLMAIENSIAGSILPNYLLLERFGHTVIGEVFLRIELAFMALPGQKIEDIHTVRSHPMALHQTQEFLARYPRLTAFESADTAESAKEISEKKIPGHAAIAGPLAAEVYGLEVLERGIESEKQNYTRFLVVSPGGPYHTELVPDKASLRFEISHRPGSLLSVLSSFVSHGINMTKLQSVPILGRPYEYSFHADVEWSDPAEYELALRELRLKTINLIELGKYKSQPRPVV